jgi:hypothetical protein
MLGVDGVQVESSSAINGINDGRGEDSYLDVLLVVAFLGLNKSWIKDRVGFEEVDVYSK